MRLWSLHPKYLDVKGLCGLWREALQAQRILAGGPPYKVPYGNHPQLLRFQFHKYPMSAIGFYLREIYRESLQRNYNFNYELIQEPRGNPWASNIWIPKGQLHYELNLLMSRMYVRNPRAYECVFNMPDKWDPWHHPLFLVDRDNLHPALWEKIKELT